MWRGKRANFLAFSEYYPQDKSPKRWKDKTDKGTEHLTWEDLVTALKIEQLQKPITTGAKDLVAQSKDNDMEIDNSLINVEGDQCTGLERKVQLEFTLSEVVISRKLTFKVWIRACLNNTLLQQKMCLVEMGAG